MELLALALVNVVTAGVMYVFFSMRFSRAVKQTVEQSRKNSLIRELKENVELTIEYINASLDTMDQKTRSFYQLLRRSEELTAQLEALHLEQIQAQAEQKPTKKAGSAASGKKKAAARTANASSKSAKAEKNEPAADAAKPARAKTSKSSAKKSSKTPRRSAEDSAAPLEGDQSSPDVFASPLLAGSDSPASMDRELRDYHPDRVLQDLGDDQLEISAAPESVESAYRGGERSRPRTAPHIPTPGSQRAAAQSQAGGVFGRIGGIARRILGIDAIPGPTATADDSGLTPGQELPPAARFNVPQLSAEELERPVPGAPLRPLRERGQSAGAASPNSSDLPQAGAQATAEGGAVLPRLDRWEFSQNALDDRGDASDATPAPGQGRIRGGGQGRVTGAGYGPAFSAQPELPPPAEILKAEGLSYGDLEDSPGDLPGAKKEHRANVIRTLLRYGYRPGDISRATGISLPEVELVASLPESGRRPRRQRLNATGQAPGTPAE